MPALLEDMGRAAREASRCLAALSSESKNSLLLDIALLLEQEKDALCAANALDMQDGAAAGLGAALLDRLELSPARVEAMARETRRVASLEDPIGQVLDGRALDSGLRLLRRRVPLGVVALIYEARPNVTVDAASLCLKTGNAVILRGGKESRRSNLALTGLIQRALAARGLPPTSAQYLADPDRKLLAALLGLKRHIDLLIPRGGPALQEFCLEHARMPIISGGIGVCHIFVDKSARLEPSLEVLVNAKTQRPSVCNALETVLVHKDIATQFIPALAARLGAEGVTFHHDAAAGSLFPAQDGLRFLPLREGELEQEWLSLDLNVVIVDGLDEAVAHIHRHGSGHSDAILTESMENAESFVNMTDSAAVYVNASTRFTDGGQFGLGAEVAVSTQKTHARGPMSLESLTTYKWIAFGDYSLRSPG